MIDLENILELEAKATPGPWALVVELAPLTLYLNDNFVQAERKEDIDLISAMRNSSKQLCAELRAAREVVIYATNFLRFTPHAGPACYSNKCVCFHGPLAESIARYDEARRG